MAHFFKMASFKIPVRVNHLEKVKDSRISCQLNSSTTSKFFVFEALVYLGYQKRMAQQTMQQINLNT